VKVLSLVRSTLALAKAVAPIKASAPCFKATVPGFQDWIPEAPESKLACQKVRVSMIQYLRVVVQREPWPHFLADYRRSAAVAKVSNGEIFRAAMNR
jgi:hypothetical protein